MFVLLLLETIAHAEKKANKEKINIIADDRVAKSSLKWPMTKNCN